MTTSEIEAISTVTRELSTMLVLEADHLDSGIHRHVWNQVQALEKLIQPEQIRPNTITIEQTDRGYQVEFPYKPNPNAIRGFHSLGMIWRSAGMDGRVTWFIPSAKIKDAVEFIEYWYSQKASPDHSNYSVEVITS